MSKYPFSTNQTNITPNFSYCGGSYCQRPMDTYNRLIKGKFLIKDIRVSAPQMIRENMDGNIKLLFYFCGVPSSVVDVDMTFRNGKLTHLIHHGQESNTDGFEIWILAEGKEMFLGRVEADALYKRCDRCNCRNVPPALIVKMNAYQEDGSNKLLGCKWMNVFVPGQEEVLLNHVSLSVFIHHGKELVSPVSLLCEWVVDDKDLHFDSKQYKELSAMMDLEHLFVCRDEMRKDKPFDVYSPYERGMMSSVVPTDTCILPKTLFYLNVGKQIKVTANWCKMLLDYHLRLYGMTLSVLQTKVYREFGLTETMNKDQIWKRLISLEQKDMPLWNSIMHVIVNAITLFIVTGNIYSYDSEDIVCKTVINGKETTYTTRQDNERNTTHCMLLERCYDCEDGAGLAVIIYQRMKEVFSTLGGIYLVLHCMMDQYEPFICVTRTSTICMGESGDTQWFPHMGALLLAKSYLNKVFHRAESPDVMYREQYTKRKLLDDTYLDHKLTTVFVMESTSAIMSTPFHPQVKRDLTSREFEDLVNYNNLCVKQVCGLAADNISQGGKGMGDFYNAILCLHPLSLHSMDKLVNNIYVMCGDKNSVSLRDIYEDYQRGSIQFYYNYVAPEEANKEVAKLMKLSCPMIKLDCDWNTYQDMVKKYMENAKMSSPYNMYIGKGKANGNTTVPYFPSHLTNSSMNDDIPSLVVHTYPDITVPDVFKPSF